MLTITQPAEKDAPDLLEALKVLGTDIIGRRLHIYNDVISTNRTACELAVNGAQEGTAVIAESQSGGRGRLGRRWHSPAGKNIYTSIILRPPVLPMIAPQLTLMTAVALLETLSLIAGGSHPASDRIGPENSSDRRAVIKWPNDILIGGRKCAGILAELKTGPDRAGFVIIGVGINVNMKNSC